MRICELMEQRGIQRIQLADAMGVSPSCITKWVQGTALPSADKLPRLAAILQCSIDVGVVELDRLLRPRVETGPQAEKGVAYDPYTGAAADCPLD